MTDTISVTPSISTITVQTSAGDTVVVQNIDYSVVVESSTLIYTNNIDTLNIGRVIGFMSNPIVD